MGKCIDKQGGGGGWLNMKGACIRRVRGWGG